MSYTAIVPVKSLSEAKTRLATYLTPQQRADLMLDMLYHVLSVLKESKAFSRISVVSPDERVLAQAVAWGVQARREEQAGHNPALTAAALHERREGSTALLTISADLPLLQLQDLHVMIEQLRWNEIVMAPSQDGTGTNALLTRPPLIVPYVFGVNSLPHYLKEAEQQGARHTLYHSIGVALDVDTIDDLEMIQDVELIQHYMMGRQAYSISC